MIWLVDPTQEGRVEVKIITKERTVTYVIPRATRVHLDADYKPPPDEYYKQDVLMHEYPELRGISFNIKPIKDDKGEFARCTIRRHDDYCI